jgi:putative phage-type endonuclease
MSDETEDTRIIHDVGSQEWVAARRRGLGASDIAAACGVSRWKSRYVLWLEKTGRQEPQPVSRAMRVGTHLERVILDDWVEEHCAEILDEQLTIQVQAEPVEIWATLDAVVTMPDGEQVALEAKHTNWRNRELGEDGTDQIPLEWICQAQCQMAASGVDVCHFAVWVDASTSREFTVQWDAELWSGLLVKAAEFWRYVSEDRVPPADWANVPERLDRFRWVEPAAPADLRNSDAAKLWERYECLGRGIAAAEKDRKRVKGEFMLAMGDSDSALVADGKEVYLLKVDRPGYYVDASSHFQIRSRKVK